MESIIAQIASYFKSDAKWVELAKSKTNLLRVFVNNFFWGLFFVGCILISFFLGRTYKFLEERPSISFEANSNPQEYFEKYKQETFVAKSTSTIVASKGGKKYYFVWCKGAGNIKEANKRYFNSEELAQKAGYTLSNTCK